MSYMFLADKALHDEPLTNEECHSVLNTPDDELLALLHAAFQVRSKYFGRAVRLQNAAECQERCLPRGLSLLFTVFNLNGAD